MRTLPLLYLCSSRLYLRQLRRIAVLQLIFAYIAVMLPSSLTVGCADCVHKYLALILMWYFRKRIKVIVIVIVQHHKAVVFFKLAFQCWQISYLLAGGGDYLHIWVTLPDMLLQQGRKDYCLVHAVVGDIQHTVANRVIQMLTGKERVCKRQAAGHSQRIESAEILGDKLIHGLHIHISCHDASAVPYHGKAVENARYLHAVVKHPGHTLYH